MNPMGIWHHGDGRKVNRVNKIELQYVLDLPTVDIGEEIHAMSTVTKLLVYYAIYILIA